MRDWTNEELQHMLAEVARRAVVNPEFRELALRDAAAAISKISSKPLPEGITFKFVDNSGPVKTVPLPDPLVDEEELCDEEFENVAGGGGNPPPPPPPPLSGGWSKIAPLGRRSK